MKHLAFALIALSFVSCGDSAQVPAARNIRPGEVWLPESGTDHVTVIKTK